MFDDTKLFEICAGYQIPKGLPVVIQEPYIPFIPPNWNGLLVLAEAQNLSKRNQKYVNRLMAKSPAERIRRILPSTTGIDIEPWDDGSLPLAIEAALDLQSDATAVSNAVLWSIRREAGTNQNPSDDLVGHSVRLWSAMLPVLQPDRIVTAGKVARAVVRQTAWAGEVVHLRHPSPQALCKDASLEEEAVLLAKFPEVGAALERNQARSWLSKYRKNKIFYACHAVSIVKADGRAAP